FAGRQGIESAEPKKAGAMTENPGGMKKPSSYLAVRLSPGTDVREFIEQWCRDEKIDAASLLSLVGSLSRACIRLAGKEEPTEYKGPFEIVSATGTLGKDGIHIHIAIADEHGNVIGGHLSRGCIVNTTVELTAANLSEEWEFKRVPDSSTNSLE